MFLQTILHSSADTLLFAIPALGLLAASVFGLDERIACPEKQPSRQSRLCGYDEQGEPILTDPDGRLSSTRIG
jgi:hypothetical protein